MTCFRCRQPVAVNRYGPRNTLCPTCMDNDRAEDEQDNDSLFLPSEHAKTPTNESGKP